MQSKDDFLAAIASAPVPVTVEGTTVHILALGATDVSACRAWQKINGDDKAYQFLFVRSVSTPEGERLFSDDDLPVIFNPDLPPTKRPRFTFINAVVDEVMKLNQMGDYAKKAPSPATTS